MSTVLANKIYLNQLFAMVISKRNITGRQTDNHWGLQQTELAAVNQLNKTRILEQIRWRAIANPHALEEI